MLKAKRIKTKFGEKESEHIFYYQSNSKCLVVLFPGGGNSCNTPILHYSRKFLLDSKCDVINVSYSNLVDNKDSTEVQVQRLASAVYEAIQEAEKEGNYSKRVFISRSFGNILSNEIKVNESFEVDKCIYISPTAEATKYFDTYPGLIITGTNDLYIPDEKIHELVAKYNDNVLVFEQGTHALENENIEESLDFCKTAVMRILKYINS